MRTEYLRGRRRGRKVQVYVELRDLWVGLYWDAKAFYVVLLPAVVVRITRGKPE